MPEYIMSSKSPQRAKKWAIAFSKPIVIIKDEKPRERDDTNKRERKEGELIKKVKEEIER